MLELPRGLYSAPVVIDALSANLMDAEGELSVSLQIRLFLICLSPLPVSDTEYQAKAEEQEKLDIYIEYLGRIQ